MSVSKGKCVHMKIVIYALFWSQAEAKSKSVVTVQKGGQKIT